jgi:hypothetical protein
VPMEDRDTKGDVYEYMLSKIASAGQNGQFRTPRHIIALMVAMTAPTPKDEICDPACGTAGFLIAAGDYLRHAYPDVEVDAESRTHFHNSLFHGFDFDSTMLRIGSMNMLLHGVEAPDIRYRDSLSEGTGEEEGLYSLVLANPPFAGSLDYESTAQNLLRVVKTKKTELLFLALFLRLLKPGGRAAVIVPDGVLFGSSRAHKELRRILVEDQKLDAIVKLPSGVFRPYAGVSTAIVLLTKTESGGTDCVWFHDVAADGWSLDDKRTPLLEEAKLDCNPTEPLSAAEQAMNNLPDVLARWADRDTSERNRARTDQSFCVPKADIVAADYDLSLNRYKELVYEDVEHRSPAEIVRRTRGDRGRDPRGGWRRSRGWWGETRVVPATIGDCITPVSTANPEKACGDDEFDYVDLGAVDQRTKVITQPTRIKGTEAPSRARQIVAVGDVVVSTVRPNLNAVARVGRDLDGAIASTGFSVLRPTARLDSGYLFYWGRQGLRRRGVRDVHGRPRRQRRAPRPQGRARPLRRTRCDPPMDRVGLLDLQRPTDTRTPRRPHPHRTGRPHRAAAARARRRAVAQPAHRAARTPPRALHPLTAIRNQPSSDRRSRKPNLDRAHAGAASPDRRGARDRSHVHDGRAPDG